MRETASIFFWLQPKYFYHGFIKGHYLEIVKIWGWKIAILDSLGLTPKDTNN